MVVDDLRRDWPTSDGQQERLGPFMAYPVCDPGTLILLTKPEFESTSTSIAVIEGGSDSAIRFELVGAERGDWLEWHPHGSIPSDFISGLGEAYSVVRYQQLEQNWFLVRY